MIDPEDEDDWLLYGKKPRPRLLDLFCGAGGAGMGYFRAGFEVVGVDIKPQPNYPFEFHQADALEYLAEHGHEFDAIHASPPCQAHSQMKARWVKTTDYLDRHVDLIPQTRDLLKSIGLPWVIENVVGSPLYDPIMLCGTMFGLQTNFGNQLLRHRLFETSFYVLSPGFCNHNGYSCVGVYGGGQNPARRKRNNLHGPEDAEFGISARRQVMGIEWMTGKELNQAIPPAYTYFIGCKLIDNG